MPDVFDEISTEPKADVFDEIAPDRPSRLAQAVKLMPQISKLMPGVIGQPPTEPYVHIPRVESSDVSPRMAEVMLSPIGARIARSVTGDADAPQKVVAGTERGLAGLAEGFESPLGFAALAIPFLHPTVGRAVSGAFGVHMGLQTPKLARDLGTAVGEGDTGKVIESGIGLTGNTLLAAGAGAHALSPRAKVISNEPPKTEVEPLKPKEPVTDVFDEVAAEPKSEPASEPVVAEPEALRESPTAPVEVRKDHPTRVFNSKTVGNQRHDLISEDLSSTSTSPGQREQTSIRVTDTETGNVISKTPYEEWHEASQDFDKIESTRPDYRFSEDDVRVGKPQTQRKQRATGDDITTRVSVDAPIEITSPENWTSINPDHTRYEIVARGKFEERKPASKSEPVWHVYNKAKNEYIAQGLTFSDAVARAKSEMVKSNFPPDVEPEVVKEPTPLESINRSPRVKLTAPEGATSVRGTDAKGRTSVQSIATISKGNPFHGADIVKLEAGTIDRAGKFKAMAGDVEVKPISVGPGAESVGEIAPSNLAQLTSAITRLADEVPETSPAKAFDFGDTLSGVKDSASSALDGLRAAGQYIARKFEGKPVWTEMKEAVGDRHLALSESVHNARKFTERALKEVPDKELQEAISNWVDTGGDEAKLGAAAVESKGKYKSGYERALRLTPEQKLFAQNLKNYFEARLEEAQKAGILEDGIENYIHRIYEADSGFKRGVLAELGSGLSTAKPGLAKQRVFEYDFEAEQAGLKPIKSFVKRVAAYDLALNKAIADRAAVKAMMEIRMADGRPAIDVAGLGTKTIPDPGGNHATLINPKWKPTDADTPKKFRGDYRAIDAPALRKWKWVSADEAGNPTFVQGDVLVHPDAYKQVNALVGRSAIRNNPIGRAALNVGSTIKQTMLDLSLFHPVQIAVHGFEHRSFFPAKEIDFTNPEVRGLIKGGMVVGETSGRQMFDEGLAGSSLTKHIPGIGPKVVALKDWIFQSYIPRLKVSTGLHALERNRARFPNLSEAELNHLTANQMNKAFGEQNYEMMARNKTAQDVFRLTALAPDFLEARAGFVAQAFTKFGREQTEALLYGAAAMYILARVMNKLIDGQYHMDLKDAFSVVHNGKAYGLRTVQGDVIHAGTDFMHFLRNRLNPAITRPVLEAVTGRDEFGRKRTAGDQVVDYVKTAIPISLKGAFQGREKTLLESLMNSTGLTVRRATATASIQTKTGEWMTKNKIQRGPGEFIYDPDKDQHRAIRLAAQEGDVAGTRAEIQKLIKAGTPYAKIIKHFSDATRRPVTGSRANDLKFYNSLSDDDKKTFNEAKKEKAAVFSVIRQAR